MVGQSLWSAPTAGRNAGALPSLAAAGQHSLSARSESGISRQRELRRRDHPPSPHCHLLHLQLHASCSHSHHVIILSLICPPVTLLHFLFLHLSMLALSHSLASIIVDELCPFCVAELRSASSSLILSRPARICRLSNTPALFNSDTCLESEAANDY